MRQLGLPFTEQWVRFDGFEDDSQFKQTVRAISPAASVPILIDEGVSDATGQPLVIADSLAIVEYAHGCFPEARVWPSDTAQRARARSLCAQMHSGFGALRRRCPMNVEAELNSVGALLWRDHADLRSDVARLEQTLGEALDRSGGPLLMGSFSAADAFYAPVVMRFATYGLPVGQTLRSYMQAVRALPSVAAWVEAACAERIFLAYEEPYRLQP